MGAPFMSGMVLQQKTAASLWGKATAKATVTIQTSWTAAPISCQADENGKWEVKVHTPAANFDKQTITMSDGDQNTVIRNILIGEVWITSGQSNMEMPVNGWTGSPIYHVDSILNTAENYSDKLRFTTVPGNLNQYPQDSAKITWQRCTRAALQNFSVLAYFFATHLIDSLNVPVGIINASYGGSNLEAWIPADVNKSFGDIVMSQSTYSQITQRTPSVCYNAMIHPIKGYTASGFLWYQGENNVYSDNDQYCFRLCKMIESWRKEWARDDMKFYIVELTPYSYGEVNGISAAYVREQQNLTQHVLDNVRMVGTNDLVLPSETEQIHPSHKLQLGQRLGDCALHDLYGFEKINPSNPEMKKADCENGKAYLSFTHVDGGFNIAEGITGFEVAGADGIFKSATATVEGDRVVVSNSAITNPIAVQYCFRNFLKGNLKNKAGLPVLPFRSDGSLIHFISESAEGNAAQQTLAKTLGYALMMKDRFAAGINPGYIDQTYYGTYQTLLSNAQNALQAGSSTDEMSRLKERLLMTDTEFDANTIPLTEGYYQIVNGYNAFKNRQGIEKAMYGGISGTLGWGTLNSNTNYIFKIIQAGDDDWTVRCVGTQSYIEPVVKSNEKIHLVEDSPGNFVFERFHKGQWGIRSVNTDEELNAFDSKNGLGTNGNIQVLGGKYGSPSSWYLRKITDVDKIHDLETVELRFQLQKVIDRCRAFNDSTFAGDSFGDVSQEEKVSFTKSIEAAADYQKATNEELADNAAKLVANYVSFRNARKSFAKGVWYYIVNMDQTMGYGTSATYASFNGNAMYLKTNNTKDCYRWLASRDILCWNYFNRESGSLSCLHNPYAMWRITSIEGKDSCYAIQNRATGTYISGTLANAFHGAADAPQPFGITLLGRNQFRLVSLDDENAGRIPLGAVASNNAVLNVAGGFSEPAAWNFIPVAADDSIGCIEIEGLSNSISVMCLPFAVSTISCKDYPIKTYSLNKMIGENALELTEKGNFVAGEPFFLMIGNLDTPSKETTVLQLPPPNDFVHEASTENGLIGVLDKMGVNQQGMVYFGNTDNAIKVSGKLTVGIEGHRGYVNPLLVSDAKGSADLVVSLSADGVRPVVSESSTVDVYSIEGSFLKQNVRFERVSENLGKGLYIIGKRKIVIK